MSSTNALTNTSTYLTGLSLFILGLLYSYSTPLINCDVQAYLTNYAWAKQLTTIISLFFLVSSTVAPLQPIWMTWVQTFILYFIFLLATKSRLYYIVSVIILLCVDQSLLSQKNYLLNQDPNADVTMINNIRQWLLVGVALVIVVGFFHYLFVKIEEYGKEFEYLTFIFGKDGSNVCHSV